MSVNDDIYSDLPEVNYDHAIKELEKHKKILEETVDSLKKQLGVALKKNESYEREIKVLTTNISALYKTAVAEIKRKDNIIADLRKRYDDVVFRKGRHSVNQPRDRRTDLKKQVPEQVPPKKVPQKNSNANDFFPELSDDDDDNDNENEVPNINVAKELPKNHTTLPTEFSRRMYKKVYGKDPPTDNKKPVGISNPMVRVEQERKPKSDQEAVSQRDQSVDARGADFQLDVGIRTQQDISVSVAISNASISSSGVLTQSSSTSSTVICSRPVDRSLPAPPESIVDSEQKEVEISPKTSKQSSPSNLRASFFRKLRTSRGTITPISNLWSKKNTGPESAEAAKIHPRPDEEIASSADPIPENDQSPNDLTQEDKSDANSNQVSSQNEIVAQNDPAVETVANDSPSPQTESALQKPDSENQLVRNENESEGADAKSSTLVEEKTSKKSDLLQVSEDSIPSMFSPMKPGEAATGLDLSVDWTRSSIKADFISSRKYEDTTLGHFDDTIQFVSALKTVHSQISPITTPVKVDVVPSIPPTSAEKIENNQENSSYTKEDGKKHTTPTSYPHISLSESFFETSSLGKAIKVTCKSKSSTFSSSFDSSKPVNVLTPRKTPRTPITKVGSQQSGQISSSPYKKFPLEDSNSGYSETPDHRAASKPSAQRRISKVQGDKAQGSALSSKLESMKVKMNEKPEKPKKTKDEPKKSVTNEVDNPPSGGESAIPSSQEIVPFNSENNSIQSAEVQTKPPEPKDVTNNSAISTIIKTVNRKEITLTVKDMGSKETPKEIVNEIVKKNLNVSVKTATEVKKRTNLELESPRSPDREPATTPGPNTMKEQISWRKPPLIEFDPRRAPLRFLPGFSRRHLSREGKPSPVHSAKKPSKMPISSVADKTPKAVKTSVVLKKSVKDNTEPNEPSSPLHEPTPGKKKLIVSNCSEPKLSSPGYSKVLKTPKTPKERSAVKLSVHFSDTVESPSPQNKSRKCLQYSPAKSSRRDGNSFTEKERIRDASLSPARYSRGRSRSLSPSRGSRLRSKSAYFRRDLLTEEHTGLHQKRRERSLSISPHRYDRRRSPSPRYHGRHSRKNRRSRESRSFRRGMKRYLEDPEYKESKDIRHYRSHEQESRHKSRDNSKDSFKENEPSNERKRKLDDEKCSERTPLFTPSSFLQKKTIVERGRSSSSEHSANPKTPSSNERAKPDQLKVATKQKRLSNSKSPSDTIQPKSSSTPLVVKSQRTLNFSASKPANVQVIQLKQDHSVASETPKLPTKNSAKVKSLTDLGNTPKVFSRRVVQLCSVQVVAPQKTPKTPSVQAPKSKSKPVVKSTPSIKEARHTYRVPSFLKDKIVQRNADSGGSSDTECDPIVKAKESITPFTTGKEDSDSSLALSEDSDSSNSDTGSIWEPASKRRRK